MEPVTDAGNTIAVITVPATDAPPIGSADVVPAVPAGAAPLAWIVAAPPAAVTRIANAPGAAVTYDEYFCSATAANAGVPEIASPTEAVLYASMEPRPAFAFSTRIAMLLPGAGSTSSSTTIFLEPVRA